MNTYAKNVATSAADAAKITPRAEFRVFGKDIIHGVQQHMWDAKATLYAARRMPAEIYFLSAKTDAANVKVRDSLLDIKLKVGETPEGFVAMAKAHPDLCAVSVEKMRYGFSVDGIICEYAQVWFNGALMETACCESEDYAGIKAAAEKLGIAQLDNINYLKAGKQVVGMA